jgi:hypothetical protein
MKNNEYTFFIESELFDITNQEDIKFLKEFVSENQSLINQEGDKFRINFVGEIVTPTNRYFSMPKNMQPNKESTELIKNVLSKYKKDETGKNLVLSQLGSYNSERVYFDKLKSYFLDYLTYEFIYPLKRKKIHSNSPISGAKISVFDTIRNRKRFGTGITYTTKDVKNTDDWILDDIYFYTIKELEERLNVSPTDKHEIDKMRDYLIGEGYSFNKLIDNKILSNKTGKELLDLSDTQDVIKKIRSCEIGIIHNPIKNTLLEYYDNKQQASANSTINVIFTKNFEKVWELILQDALMDEKSNQFKEREKSKFNKREIEEEFIPLSELENRKKEFDILEPEEVEDLQIDKWIEKRGNRYFFCKKGRLLIPDIFVDIDDDKKFIGDAKYYRDPSDSNYDKEFYIYNDAQSNKYPMVIFAIPESDTDRTTVPRRGYRRASIPNGGIRELILITVCVKDVINDAISDKTKKVSEDSIYLISKYTRKPEWQKEFE